MGISDYAKRVLSGSVGQPKKSPDSPMARAAIVAVIGIFVLGLAGWLLGFGGQTVQSTDCAFRITEADAPPPVTEGDAAQLNTCVRLERVASGAKRTLGLSNRPSLPWDQGMLFDFEKAGRYCMWMKDMRFSLDILWVNEQYEIVAMQKDASPATYPRQSFCGPDTARYVIEVNAGVIQAGDLRLGQHITL